MRPRSAEHAGRGNSQSAGAVVGLRTAWHRAKSHALLDIASYSYTTQGHYVAWYDGTMICFNAWKDGYKGTKGNAWGTEVNAWGTKVRERYKGNRMG